MGLMDADDSWGRERCWLRSALLILKLKDMIRRVADGLFKEKATRRRIMQNSQALVRAVGGCPRPAGRLRRRLSGGYPIELHQKEQLATVQIQNPIPRSPRD